jgi:hypothetical protein
VLGVGVVVSGTLQSRDVFLRGRGVFCLSLSPPSPSCCPPAGRNTDGAPLKSGPLREPDRLTLRPSVSSYWPLGKW